MIVKYSTMVLSKLRKGTPSSAAWDIATLEPVIIPPGTYKKIGTGVFVEIPEAWQGILTHRSGLNSKRGGWAYGVIDSDYRGELYVTLFNHDPNREIRLDAGEYFAQLDLVPRYCGGLIEADTLSKTIRGEGGHGSTGK